VVNIQNSIELDQDWFQKLCVTW